MWSRNILVAAAITTLSALPALAQQKTPTPMKPVAAVSRDSTHAKPRKHSTRSRKHSKSARNTNAATPATPATPASPANTTVKPEQKTAKHHNKAEQKKPITETKKP
jgi:hypothetical protein